MTEPDWAARYPRRPNLRRLIALIEQEDPDEHGAIALGHAEVAARLGIRKVFAGCLINKLRRDGLLTLHTSHRVTVPPRAATYTWDLKS